MSQSLRRRQAPSHKISRRLLCDHCNSHPFLPSPSHILFSPRIRQDMASAIHVSRAVRRAARRGLSIRGYTTSIQEKLTVSVFSSHLQGPPFIPDLILYTTFPTPSSRISNILRSLTQTLLPHRPLLNSSILRDLIS
jgi:hypothetical protein